MGDIETRVVNSTSSTFSGSLLGDVTGTQSATVLSAFAAGSASQALATDGSKNVVSLPYASANTASALVIRDVSGNFSAGTITAALSGNATTATSATTATTATNFSGSLVGDVTGTQGATTIANSAVTNAKIVAAAGISVNKLAALTVSRAVASNASGFIVAATTTATELDLLTGSAETSTSGNASVYGGAGSISSGTVLFETRLRRMGNIVAYNARLSGTYNITGSVTSLGVTLPAGFTTSNTQTAPTATMTGNGYKVIVSSSGIEVKKQDTTFNDATYTNNEAISYISGSYII